MTTIKAIRLASLVTAINVLAASGFSIAAIIRPQYLVPAGSVPTQTSLILAMYAAARTIPLALFALGAIYKQATPALLILMRSPAPCTCWMPESVCLSMILGNALGRYLSPFSNWLWCICFTDPCGSRRKPRTGSAGTSFQTCPTSIERAYTSFHVYPHQRISYWDRLRTKSPDWIDRRQLGLPLRYLASRPLLLPFLGYGFTPCILTLRAIGELVNDKPRKTPSRFVPPQSSPESLRVLSCNWASRSWNDHRAGSGNYRSCGRNIRRSGSLVLAKIIKRLN
jgi:hypothetical protein